MSGPVIDLDDFDAVGVVADLVVDLRQHVMVNRVEASATVSAPEGWHRVVCNVKGGGSTVLVVRFADLSVSRLRNVADALDARGWQLDEDREGATLRQPPGTTATDVAFEVLAALGVAGAPRGARAIEARDADGGPVTLST